MMLWLQFVIVLSILFTSNCINRPVLKIVLNQKGYAQFIQYDVETPPLREFTLCAWIRINDLAGDQSIFTYVGSGSTRIIRLWLDSGGRQIKISINARVTSSTSVEFTVDAWRHICLSYQSDYGAWALYLDSRLVYCQSSHKLLGFIIPGGGSLILGYGTSEKGSPNGLEGEIYGASMILFSTIERNYTLKKDPTYKQKPFRKNQIKVKTKQDNKYIVLGDLQTDEIRDDLHETSVRLPFNKTRSFIHFTTPYSFIEHDVGIDSASRNPKLVSSSIETEMSDVAVTNNLRIRENEDINFWNLETEDKNTKVQYKSKKNGLTESGTHHLDMVFDYETPPSLSAPTVDYSAKDISIQTSLDMDKTKNKMFNNQYTDIIHDVEKPPPPEDQTKVYGQWTSSKFVGNVLKYLKSINFNKNREHKKVPSTIPLAKLTDSFPYHSEFKITKIRPPRKFNKKHFIGKRHTLTKRDTKQGQINLQIVETDIRGEILKLHSETQPKLVEVTNRGEAKHKLENRFNRNVGTHMESLELGETSDNFSKSFKQQQQSAASSVRNQKILTNLERHRGSNPLTILPFLKSVDYFMNDNNNNETKETDSNLMYSKSLANANKWHNVKSYNNDYTPRRINLEPDGKTDIEAKIAEVNKKHPLIRLKYNHDERKLVVNNDDTSIVKGRVLAEEVSNQANANKDSISILKYNHGFLPGHEKKMKMGDKINSFLKVQNKVIAKSNFYKNVKLGNALNERHIIGLDKEQRKQSFVGGNDEIPDINRYRSDWDNESENIPSSLGPRVCKNVELYDRVLYIQQDGSIDMTHILSPVREKNIGIEFITQNYKKCSMRGSTLENSSYLLIDWSKTPVRLFGGAYPKKTTDLCGFF